MACSRSEARRKTNDWRHRLGCQSAALASSRRSVGRVSDRSSVGPVDCTKDTPSLCTWEVIRTTGMCRHFDIAFLAVRRSGLIELLADTYSPNSHRSILPLANERSRTYSSQGDTSTLIMVSVHLGLFRARRFMELSNPVDAHWGNFALITSRGVIVAFLVVQGRDRSRRSLDDWKFCRNPSS